MLGGLFGVFSKNHLARDLYVGVDYHSHLGTEIGCLAYLDGDIRLVHRDVSNMDEEQLYQLYLDAFGDKSLAEEVRLKALEAKIKREAKRQRNTV